MIKEYVKAIFYYFIHAFSRFYRGGRITEPSVKTLRNKITHLSRVGMEPTIRRVYNQMLRHKDYRLSYNIIL